MDSRARRRRDEDWEFLPTGDAFVTRTVKAAGRTGCAWQPRSRHRAHRRLIGLWAPADAIRAAEEQAKATSEKRAAARTVNARSRARREQQYHEQLREAVLAFLDFAPEHAELAEQIATEIAAHAAMVGSGRAGRTQLFSLEEKARLAARAHIRHRHTQYEDGQRRPVRRMGRRRALPRDQRRRPRSRRRLPRRTPAAVTTTTGHAGRSRSATVAGASVWFLQSSAGR